MELHKAWGQPYIKTFQSAPTLREWEEHSPLVLSSRSSLPIELLSPVSTVGYSEIFLVYHNLCTMLAYYLQDLNSSKCSTENYRFIGNALRFQVFLPTYVFINQNTPSTAQNCAVCRGVDNTSPCLQLYMSYFTRHSSISIHLRLQFLKHLFAVMKQILIGLYKSIQEPML